MNGQTSVTLFGGGDKVSETQMVISSGGSRIVVDWGLQSHLSEMYFPGNLGPPSGYGIKNYLSRGILPEIPNFYRRDLLYLADRLDLAGLSTDPPYADGVILSHHHIDHCNGFFSIRHEIPVFCSKGTYDVLKILRKFARSKWGDEVMGFQERYPILDSDLVELLKKGEGERTKLSKLSSKPYRTRRFRTENEEIIRLPYLANPKWKDLYNETEGKRFNEVRERTFYKRPRFKIGGFRVETYPVDHCIGACAYIIYTPDGLKIAYTGDIRRHGKYGYLTNEFVARAAKVGIDVLIIEGTRINEMEEKTEAQVKEEMEKLIMKSDGSKAVFIDFNLTDLERIETAMQVAEATGRELVLHPYRAAIWYSLTVGSLENKKPINPSIKLPKVYKIMRGVDLPYNYPDYENDVYQRLDALDPYEINKNPGKYIVFMSFNQLPFLDVFEPPPNSLLVNSKPDWWDENSHAIKITKDIWADPYDLQQVSVHSHHHGSQQTIRDIVRGINPRTVIPVHTKYPQHFVELFGKDFDVRLPEREVPIYIEAKKQIPVEKPVKVKKLVGVQLPLLE